MVSFDAVPIDLVINLLPTRDYAEPARYLLVAGSWYFGYRKYLHLRERIEHLEKNCTSMDITWIGTPNYTKSRLGYKPAYIVIHWINGNLALADAAFSRESRKASAHFGVEDAIVHQYVKLEDTAWGCGNWIGNLQGVNIEHSAQPGRDASELTYETSSRLISEIWKKTSVIPLKPHNEFSATQCPGTLDLNRLYQRALVIYREGIGDVPITPVTQGTVASAPLKVPTTFWVNVTTTLRVRSAATTKSQDHPEKVLHTGDRLEITEAVHGESVAGNNVWLRTKVSGLYIWSGGTNYK